MSRQDDPARYGSQQHPPVDDMGLALVPDLSAHLKNRHNPTA